MEKTAYLINCPYRNVGNSFGKWESLSEKCSEFGKGDMGVYRDTVISLYFLLRIIMFGLEGTPNSGDSI